MTYINEVTSSLEIDHHFSKIMMVVNVVGIGIFSIFVSTTLDEQLR